MECKTKNTQELSINNMQAISLMIKKCKYLSKLYTILRYHSEEKLCMILSYLFDWNWAF